MATATTDPPLALNHLASSVNNPSAPPTPLPAATPDPTEASGGAAPPLPQSLPGVVRGFVSDVARAIEDLNLSMFEISDSPEAQSVLQSCKLFLEHQFTAQLTHRTITTAAPGVDGPRIQTVCLFTLRHLFEAQVGFAPFLFANAHP